MARQAAATELSDVELDKIMRAARSAVDNGFDAHEHLPEGIFKLLQPIATSTCQGLYTTTMIMVGSMAALTNGGSVCTWN